MISPEQRARILIVKEHLKQIEDAIKKVDAIILTMTVKYLGIIELLCSIPSFDNRSAITVISEIGTDMSQFVIRSDYAAVRD